MSTVSIGPGDDVEAWCTRCRMNLYHRVIALVGNSVRTVHCLTCGGDHKYHPPKNVKASEEKVIQAKTAKVGKSSKPNNRSTNKAIGEWTLFMNEMPPGTVPRSYRVSDAYGSREYIEHPVFGTGRVIDIVGAEKIQVIFKEGRKVLICNKSKKPDGNLG